MGDLRLTTEQALAVDKSVYVSSEMREAIRNAITIRECPLCAGAGTLWQVRSPHNNWYISCSGCGNAKTPQLNTVGEALKFWNYRPSEENDLHSVISLAHYMWKTWYKTDAPEWEPCDTIAGVLTQIDNMLTGLTRQGYEHTDFAMNSPKENEWWYAKVPGYDALCSVKVGGLDRNVINVTFITGERNTFLISDILFIQKLEHVPKSKSLKDHKHI